MIRSEKESHFGGRTRYAVLAEALLQDIQTGRYPVGSLLPPETDLCREFDVSRHTVREALRRLVDLGLLHRQAGIGTTVRADRLAARYVQAGENASELMRYVRDVNLRITGSENIVADANLAALVDTPVGKGWLHLSGERFLASSPDTLIALTDIWIARRFRSIADGLVTPSRPLYSLIEREFGITTAEIRQNIEAVCLSADVARRLGAKSGAPGLRITRTYVSSEDEIFETAISLHPADRFSYATTLRVETSAPDNT